MHLCLFQGADGAKGDRGEDGEQGESVSNHQFFFFLPLLSIAQLIFFLQLPWLPLQYFLDPVSMMCLASKKNESTAPE